jgi:hypothetical protein
MKSTEWVAPKAGTKYRVLCDPCIATGIRRISDGLPADISVEDNIKLRALGWTATSMADNTDENSGMPVQHYVGSLPHGLNLLLKCVNALQGFGKLLLQCLKCGRAHSGDVSSNSQTNVKAHAPALATPHAETGGEG